MIEEININKQNDAESIHASLPTERMQSSFHQRNTARRVRPPRQSPTTVFMDYSSHPADYAVVRRMNPSPSLVASINTNVSSRLETILKRHKSHPQLGKEFHDLCIKLPVLNLSDGFRVDWKCGVLIFNSQFQSAKRPWTDSHRIDMDSSSVVDIDGGVEQNKNKLWIDRLDELEREDPVRLIAYIYHMCIAIFAGGYRYSTF